jgi:hypothetical protein
MLVLRLGFLLLLLLLLPLLGLLMLLFVSAGVGRRMLEGKKGVLWADGRSVLLLVLLLPLVLLLLLLPLLLKRVGVNCNTFSAASVCPAAARRGTTGKGER